VISYLERETLITSVWTYTYSSRNEEPRKDEVNYLMVKGKGKGKGKIVPVLYFNWAPRHEGVSGMEV
jgi:hypothetical protein